MWIVRNKNGSLELFQDKPLRHEDDWICEEYFVGYIEEDLFSHLKWEDEPIEVGLIDINTLIYWFERIAQIAGDKKTLNGKVMKDQFAFEEIEAYAQRAANFIKTHIKQEKK